MTPREFYRAMSWILVAAACVVLAACVTWMLAGLLL